MASARTGLVIKPIAGMAQAIRSLYQKPSNTIRGIDDNAWFSPLQPVQPFGPPGTEPRAFQIWSGQNLIYTPRSDAEFAAADLKQLATYPLARICIENVKDTITRAPWEIQLKPKLGETRSDTASRAKDDPNIKKLNDFFTYPDREHNWQEWLRPLLDDMLVADNASILIRKTFKGDVVELPVIRGEMIVRYIDENGFTPMPPAPAYAQNWWGLPLVNLSTDQLVYKPRNIVPRNTMSSQLYGMSPTEQMAAEIQIGIKRLEFVLSYYCYSEDTEVLTKRGWLKFSDTNQGDEFATRQINSGIFEWQRATEHFHKHYDGDMIHFHGSSLDLLVTPNHRMLVDSLPRKLRCGKPYRKQEHVIAAEDLARTASGRTKIPITSRWIGKEIGSMRFPAISNHGLAVEMTGDQYCAFMGMYLAEGSLNGNRIQIKQPKDERGTHALYEELLEDIFGKVYFGHDQFEIARDGLSFFLRQFGHANEKFIPLDIREATPAQLEIFWKYYYVGDGRHTNQTQQAFTVSKKLADQLTEIIQKMGSASTTWFRPAAIKRFHTATEDRLIHARAGYLVSRRNYSHVSQWSSNTVEYHGCVCCVVVPNKFLYVRRNGKACWSGNTEGSVPGVVQVVPRGTPPAQIEEAMDWMNSQLAGNLAKRNQWRMVQGFNEPGKADQILFPKEPLLAGLYDEKHIREIAFGYGTSPQRLMKMIRTEGKGSSDAAEIQGTLPWILWVKGIIDHIIQKKFGLVDYEIAIDPYAEPDPLKNAAALTMLVSKAILTPNEARKRVGEELRQEPEADQLGVIAGTGFIPLGAMPALSGVNVDDDSKETTLVPGVVPGGAKNGGGGAKNATRMGTPVSQESGGGRSSGRNVGIPSGKESLDNKKKISKRLGARIEPDVLTAESTQAVHKVYTAVHNAFQRQHTRAKIATNNFHKILGNILEKRKFGNVQFNLDPDDAAKVLAIEINGDDFAPKGRDMNPHTTVLFGFHPQVTADEISAITKGIGDVPVLMQGFEAFPEGEDGVPLVIRVESSKLRKLHEDLKVLPHTDSWPEYKPHICVAYLKPGTANKYVAAGNPLEGETFFYSQLVHSGVDYAVSELAKLMLPSARILRAEGS